MARATFRVTGPINDAAAAVQFPDPAVGPNGELYVAWHHRGVTSNFMDDEVRIDRDLNGLFDDPVGSSDFGTDVTAVTFSIALLLEFTATGVPAQPSRGITNGPVLDVDRSGGTYNGRLYLTYVDGFAGYTYPDFDVFLVSSDNQGTTWTDMGTSRGNVAKLNRHRVSPLGRCRSNNR